MSAHLYLITGAGGGNGGVSKQVIERLRERGHRVRANTSRRRSRRSAARTRRRSRSWRLDQPVKRCRCDGRRRPHVLFDERFAGLPNCAGRYAAPTSRMKPGSRRSLSRWACPHTWSST
jgi:nucleoside-diphosphate-sugar epimerase